LDIRTSTRIACLLLPVLPGGAAALPARPAPVIVGYVFGRGEPLHGAAIAAEKLTHVNFAFAELRRGRLAIASPEDAAALAVLTGLRQRNPELRVLVSAGGWLGSKGFSDLARSEARRSTFVRSVVDVLRRYDLDGLDLDWEYPGLPGNGNPHRPADRQGFTALLDELRHALDQDGARRGRRLLLTIAAGAFADYLVHVDMPRVQASVDFVNLMSYDFRLAEAGDEAGHHANLLPRPDDPRNLSASGAVRDFLAAGVPAAKLVLGVPFYGRAWRGVTGGRDGLYREGKPAKDLDVSSYTAIEALARREGWSRGWDDAAQAPYLWNARRGLFVSYEDPRSLRAKALFVRERGLAGVMFWEYHADPSGVLLDALAAGLRGSLTSGARGGERP
jgi:chitinase